MLFLRNLFLKYKLKTIDQNVDFVFPESSRNLAREFFHQHMNEGRMYCEVDCRTNSIHSSKDFYRRASFRFETTKQRKDGKILICCDNYSNDSFVFYDPFSHEVTLETESCLVIRLAASFNDFILKICEIDDSFYHRMRELFPDKCNAESKKQSFYDTIDVVSFIKQIGSAHEILEFDLITKDYPALTNESYFFRACFSFEFPVEKYINKNNSHWWIIGNGLGDDDAGLTQGPILVNKTTGGIGLGIDCPESMPSFSKGSEYITLISSDFGAFVASLLRNDAKITNSKE